MHAYRARFEQLHLLVLKNCLCIKQVLESKGEHQKALQRCKDALDIFVAKSGSVSDKMSDTCFAVHARGVRIGSL